MHHLHLLYTQATPYAPVDVSHYRLARNPELKELILQLGDHLIKDNWKRAETPYSLFKALIREAVHKGEIVDAEVVDPEGEITVQRCVRVKASYRYLGEVIATNQKNLVTHIEKLESRGLAKRDKSVPRKIDDPSTFLLIPGLRRDYGKDVEVWRDYGKGGKEDERSALLYLSLHLALVSPHTNRLRNSTPTHTPRRGVTPGTRKVRSTNPSDKVDGISRLGKGAEYLIDMLMVWTDGGEKSISEEMLARVAHYNNRRALTTSQLFRKLRSAGIIEIKDHQVRLTPEWVTFLQIAKDEGAEDMTDQQQIESHRQQRKTFKERREVTK